MSVADMRYRQVLDALAVVANNEGGLPSLALMRSGTANVTNTVSVDTATLWDASVKGFSKETLTAFGQHNPELQWTVVPVVTTPQLEALGFACQWAVRQAEDAPPPGPYAQDLLRELTVADVNGCAKPCSPSHFHFGVLDQLRNLPPGWLHVTRNGLAPKHACFKATCGHTTVWVAPMDSRDWHNSR